MRTAIVLVLMLVASLVSSGFALPSTAPAFFWSPRYEVSNDEVTEIVNYQTISAKDLGKSVMSQGHWSEILCSRKNLKQHAGLALVFFGNELQSSDISRNNHVDPALLNLLKDSYTNSNLSLAFPYVVTSADESMENALVSGFVEACGNDIEMKNVVVVGSCSIKADESRKIIDHKSLHDYLVSRRERRLEGAGDVIIFCQGESDSLNELGLPSSEGETFSELLKSMEELDEKYSVLYVSDPLRSVQYPSIREVGRFLAEASNGSSNSTCDGVCQIKSSLLEGLLVGIVLLVILISGLCCMAGIQTPTRFETPHES